MSVSGPQHPQWRGGVTMHSQGYRLLHRPEHPRVDANGYVPEHILVVEAVLGRPLPPHAVIHHVNGDKADNRHSNLVVCQDQTYHMWLHRRAKARAATGSVEARRCRYCGEWDMPGRGDFVIHAARRYPDGQGVHRSCNARYQRELQRVRRSR